MVPRWCRPIALVIAVAVILPLGGCGSKTPAPLALAQNDSGSKQTLAMGQQTRISLESNPSTGYRWALDGPLPPIVVQSGEPTYTAGSGAIGAGGTEVWTFTAVKAGTGTLKLKYWRSFEPTTPPAETFTVDLTVK